MDSKRQIIQMRIIKFISAIIPTDYVRRSQDIIFKEQIIVQRDYKDIFLKQMVNIHRLSLVQIEVKNVLILANVSVLYLMQSTTSHHTFLLYLRIISGLMMFLHHLASCLDSNISIVNKYFYQYSYFEYKRAKSTCRSLKVS